MAGFGVIDLALHDVDEEADYNPAIVGLLADDVGEGYGDFFGLVFFGEHMFYGNGCRRLGSRGEWRGGGFVLGAAPGNPAAASVAPNHGNEHEVLKVR